MLQGNKNDIILEPTLAADEDSRRALGAMGQALLSNNQYDIKKIDFKDVLSKMRQTGGS
jgi:hypothetical protein